VPRVQGCNAGPGGAAGTTYPNLSFFLLLISIAPTSCAEFSGTSTRPVPPPRPRGRGHTPRCRLAK
jgi:hypothetical protein